MATRKKLVEEKSMDETIEIETPDWEEEASITHRALWEVVAMEGNVAPSVANVKAKKRLNTKWKDVYEKRIRVLSNALSPTLESSSPIVYYERERSGNASRIRQKKLREVRVSVLSAIDFIESSSNEKALPEGLKLIRDRLSLNDSREEHISAISTCESPTSSTQNKSASHRDQTKRNQTAEKNKLCLLVYVLANGLFDNSSYDMFKQNLPLELSNHIKDLGLRSTYGFGQQPMESILKEGYEQYQKYKA